MPTISKKKPKEVELPVGVTFVSSSGNIFADLGLPDPEILLQKAKLTSKIQQVIDDRKLTMTKAAKLLGVPTDSLKQLLLGPSSEFSIDRLLQYLAAFGQTFEITLRPMDTQPIPARSNRETPGPTARA
jgi:predicted XRE-type DNA-binding protein